MQNISLKFELKNGDKIFVCGYKSKEALKYASIWIEFDVPEKSRSILTKKYIPGEGSTGELILWNKRKHIFWLGQLLPG